MKLRLTSPMTTFFRLRCGRTLGLILFTAGLCFYRSTHNSPVFGLWSYPWFSLIAIAAALTILSFAVPFLGSQVENINRRAATNKLFDLAVLSNGLAYFLMALDHPSGAAGILNLSVWGGVTPLQAAFGWVALVLSAVALLAWLSERFHPSGIKTLTPIASVIFVLLLGEGIVRFKILASPAVLGYGALTTQVWFRTFVNLNRLRFRDGEHAPAAPAGISRLLVVGDSFAYGWGIPDIQSRFGERLASDLTQRTNNPWVAINASHPGTNTLHHEEYLRRMLTFKPALVILLYVFNDIEYLQDDDLSDFSVSWPVKVLLSNSYLCGEIFGQAWRSYYRLKGHQEAAFGASEDPYASPVLLERHLRDLDRFVAAARENGSAVAIVPFDPDVKVLGVSEYRYKRFIEEARRSGLPIIDPAGSYKSHSYRSLILNNLDRHPSVLANEVVAENVANQLVSAGRLDEKLMTGSRTEKVLTRKWPER